MTVEHQSNRSARCAPPVKAGQHRVRSGFVLPGFPRIGGTRPDYKVKSILARNGREVADEDAEGTR